MNDNSLNNCSGIYESVHWKNRWRDIGGSMVYGAMEDVEAEFERYPARSVPSFLHGCDLDL